jgi:hypothetical protein
MKVATRGAKPEWIDRPSNVIGMNICRLSGKLPNHGCGDVLVVMNDGQTEARSMIYTEYFVRGTQPATICPLHDSPSFMERLAGVFGRDADVAVSASEIGVPLPPPTSTTGRAKAARGDERRSAGNNDDDKKNDDEKKTDSKEEKAEEPKKKRGFWSRLFGVGDDEDKKKKEEERRKEEERKRSQKKPGGGT